MKKIFTIPLIVVAVCLVGWLVWLRFAPINTVISNHQILVERIEAMGKLELVKYRLSDVIEHKNISTYLPDASVLLIVKADAVGCIDLTHVNADHIKVSGDSVSIELPAPEICYVRIDHDHSRVYDTKMAFFREARLVDEAYKSAEQQIMREVRQSDILEQTKSNAIHVLRPLIEGLGYAKIHLVFSR